MQKQWADAKVFESDADDAKKEKFFVTFPYPYMNGVFHVGHAFRYARRMRVAGVLLVVPQLFSGLVVGLCTKSVDGSLTVFLVCVSVFLWCIFP